MISELGPVGLGGIINCLSRGARVICLARNRYRTKLAYELGAEAVIDPGKDDVLPKIRKLTNKIGFDKAIECSGGIIYQRLLINAAKRRDKIAFVGESGELTVNASDELI